MRVFPPSPSSPPPPLPAPPPLWLSASVWIICFMRAGVDYKFPVN